MSYWDSTTLKVIHYPDKPSEKFPGWTEVDCNCCGGLMWGGDEPRECSNCRGAGYYFRHEKSGVLAEYPGGKLLGRESRRANKPEKFKEGDV